jgi:hypothetical protein
MFGIPALLGFAEIANAQGLLHGIADLRGGGQPCVSWEEATGNAWG